MCVALRGGELSFNSFTVAMVKFKFDFLTKNIDVHKKLKIIAESGCFRMTK